MAWPKHRRGRHRATHRKHGIHRGAKHKERRVTHHRASHRHKRGHVVHRHVARHHKRGHIVHRHKAIHPRAEGHVTHRRVRGVSRKRGHVVHIPKPPKGKRHARSKGHLVAQTISHRRGHLTGRSLVSHNRNPGRRRS